MTKIHCDVCDSTIESSVATTVMLGIGVRGDQRLLAKMASHTHWDLCVACARRVDCVLYPLPKPRGPYHPLKGE